MNKKTLTNIAVAAGGGITGIMCFFAVYGPQGAALHLRALFALIFAGCALSTLLWVLLTLGFVYTFKSEPEAQLQSNGIIFAIPSLLLLVLPLYLKLYPKLAAYTPEVLGNIYVPFKGYVLANMAQFFMISAVGAAWLAVFFLLMAKFISGIHASSAGMTEARRKKSVFWAVFIFLVMTTSFVTFVYPPTGDEPHYLVAARSIARDFDVNLENNYSQRKEYEKFYPVELPYRNIHTVADSGGRGVYTIRGIGLPAVIAPLAALQGRFWIQFFMNLCAAALCAALYLMLSRLGISTAVSAAAALIACVCMPVMAGSSLVLTEVPAALLLAWCVYAVAAGNAGRRNLLFFAALAFLPWLHIKFAVFSAAFYVYYYFTAVKEKRISAKNEALNHLPVIVSAVLFFWYYHAVYGINTPFGITKLIENSGGQDALARVNRFVLNPGEFMLSSVAVLFDRDYGLLPYCPLFALSLTGIALAFAKKDLRALLLLALFAPYTVILLLWRDWTGSMTPARQLIPLVPALVYYAAYFCENLAFARSRIFRALLGLSLIISWLLAAAPVLRYEASKMKIYAFLSHKIPAVMLWLLPPFRENTAAGLAVSGLYAALMAWMYAYALSKMRKAP